MSSSTQDDAKDHVKDGAFVSVSLLQQGDEAQQQQRAVSHEEHFSLWSLLGLGYALLNTWGASSSSIYIGLSSGGPVAVVWGNICGTLGALTIAISLAEMCHLLPLISAQYGWTYALSKNHSSTRRILSYLSGWFGLAGWLAITSTAPYFSASCILLVAQLFHPDFNPGPWFVFVLYVALSLGATLMNVFGVRRLHALNMTALYWSLVSSVTLTVVLLAVAGHDRPLNSGRFVFATFTNETGWPDGIAWILGLLQTSYSLVGADGAAHLVREIARPERNVPLAMVLSCIIGGLSALVVCLAFLATMTDPVAVSKAAGGCAVVAIQQAVNSLPGTACLFLFYLFNQVFSMPALMATTSRTIQALAEDGCLPFRSHLSRVSPRWEAPIYAVCLNGFFLVCFGCLIFASPLALFAIQGAGVVLLQLSYVPCLLSMLLKRHTSPMGRKSPPLGLLWGRSINVLALAYIALTNVVFLFPAALPVTGPASMNWACVIVVGILFLALINWALSARHRFVAPHGLEMSDD